MTQLQLSFQLNKRMGAGNIEDEVAPLQMRLYIAQQAVKDLEKIRTYIYFKAELLD